MRKYLLLVLLLFLFMQAGICQTDRSEQLNLDFERVADKMPEGWITFGGEGYTVEADERNSHGGSYSAFIESTPDGDADFKAWNLTIPGSYEGEKITLTGYIRTEHVADGYAGLWMRIDPEVAFDNMHDRGLSGTTDWTRMEITLPLDPLRMTQIAIGGLLIGKGKMWIDDLNVTIDGEDIRTLTPIVRKEKSYPAQQDHAFDAGSGINNVRSDRKNVRALKELGLIWGFLKYYHPAVAAGNYNWDYELFRILPSVLSEKRKVRREAALVRWIESLGPVEERAVPDSEPLDSKILPDLKWIRNSGFSDELVAVLAKIQHAERGYTHYYIGVNPYAGNPEFLHENSYASMRYPDAGYRLLALYRYWNMIQYFYPNRELIGEDWTEVLEVFVPRFAEAANEEEYLLAALEVIARIHDTHANLWMNSAVLNRIRGMHYAAPIVEFVEGKAAVVGFHDEALGAETGLQVGDVITKIGGKPVGKIVKERLKTTPASNYPTQLRDIAEGLLRTNDSLIHIRYSRAGEQNEVVLATYGMRVINPYLRGGKKIPALRFLPDSIACLYPASLKNGEINTLWKQIEHARGLIVDLRCYPSDFIVFTLGMRLVPENTQFVKFTYGNIRTPGLFTFGQVLSVGSTNPDYYRGKVVILVNETTQSQAEYTAMALRVAPKAVVVGSTTAGADGNVSEILLPGAVRTMISGIGILYPDNRETQRVGIVPDVEIKPTLAGIAAGRDEVLEKAVDLILE